MSIYSVCVGPRGLNSGPQAQWQASLPLVPLPICDVCIFFPVELVMDAVWRWRLLSCPFRYTLHWLAPCGLSPSSEEYRGQTDVSDWDRTGARSLGKPQQLNLREFENRSLQWVIPGPVPSSHACPGGMVTRLF